MLSKMPPLLRGSFQSSRSLRTATAHAIPASRRRRNFNPRGPCGPRLLLPATNGSMAFISILAVLADRDQNATAPDAIIALISILAVLADRDHCVMYGIRVSVTFQSSRSLRTATRPRSAAGQRPGNFNPRGPCGPRLTRPAVLTRICRFQSSRSLRTATRKRLSPISMLL